MSHIISFGCSWTSGCEFLDHEIHPKADKIKRKHGMTFWNQHHCPSEREPSMILRNQRAAAMAWAGIIAARKGWTFHSHAKSGTSLAYQVLLLENAIARGEITDTTWVLVGVTLKERSLWWKDHNQVGSWQLNRENNWPNPLWHGPTVAGIYQEQYMQWLFLQDLLRLCQLSDRFGGRIKLFSMMKHSFIELSQSKDQAIQRRYQEVIDSGHAYIDRDLCSIATSEQHRHGGGHPTVAVHELFADWAIEQLERDFNPPRKPRWLDSAQTRTG